MQPVRVLIVDDQHLVREVLQLYLQEQGLNVVGVAQGGREAARAVESLRPDVVLMDVCMPDLTGFEALSAIRRVSESVRVIMLSSSTDPQHVTRSIALGASGYLSKDIQPAELSEVILAVARGETVIDGELRLAALDLLASLSTPDPEPDSELILLDELTQQEMRVLQLMAGGLNNRNIASNLALSHNTVKTHIRHIYEKLGTSDRTQAAVWALQHGLA